MEESIVCTHRLRCCNGCRKYDYSHAWLYIPYHCWSTDIPKHCISCRSVLWCLVFTGAGVNYMIRTNINIAIVAMVWNQDRNGDNTAAVTECYQPEFSQTHSMKFNFSNVSSIQERSEEETRFNWDEKQQAYVLGAFYWFYWSTQIPGGILSQRYGFKVVFGCSNLFICVTTFLIPLFATVDPWALVALRMIQGLVGGTAWPSLHVAAGHWIPPKERSKFMSAIMGSSLGAALTYPVCGLIIYYLGWEAVFYITGAIGIIWFIAWWLLVFDTPNDHPRISEKELKYIQSSCGRAVQKRKPPIPWKSILTSVPMWMNIFAQWGGIWGLFTLLTQAPTFFRYIHGMNVRMTGILSGIPHLCRVIVAIIVSFFGDYALKKEILSRTAVRKVATTICTLFNGLFVLGLAYSGCNSVAAIICLTLSVSCSGAVSTGPLASLVDIGPNFAGVVLGITNMITVAPGFISPIIVGKLTYQNQTSGQWQVVFLISAIMLFIAGILYLLFSSSDVQPWNSSGIPEKEMKVLNSKEPAEEEEKLKLNNETVPDTENNCP
ncbi:sialin isoform X5 [Anabrus simplex]|uniref:sialin isoform X5 n=1 Tax=Anabrus simplex TaxID=316456 RepID=UPI0035A2DA83